MLRTNGSKDCDSENLWIADLAEDADELQSRLCIAPTEVLPSERWWFYPRVKK